MLSLDVNKINVFYGDLQVLYNVSFRMNEKEITALIGANAAGKTTTLKTISGLVRAKSGTISYKGQRIDSLKPEKITELGIIHVPEGRLLFPYMSVLENLEMGAYTKKARERKKANLEWVFQLFPILEKRKKQQAGTLSGGEQQMLAIGRGLMASPELLMFDEPSLGLGPKIVLKIFEVIEEINKEGVTILLVEQNVGQALTVASKAYVLENGRIFLEGKSEELLRNEHVKKAYLGM